MQFAARALRLPAHRQRQQDHIENTFTHDFAHLLKHAQLIQHMQRLRSCSAEK